MRGPVLFKMINVNIPQIQATPDLWISLVGATSGVCQNVAVIMISY